MGFSKFIRGLTWLVVAAIALSVASPATAAQDQANNDGSHAVAASAQAGAVALQDLDPPIPVAPPAPAWPEAATW